MPAVDDALRACASTSLSKRAMGAFEFRRMVAATPKDDVERVTRMELLLQDVEADRSEALAKLVKMSKEAINDRCASDPGMPVLKVEWLLTQIAQTFVNDDLVPPPRSEFHHLSFDDVLEVLSGEDTEGAETRGKIMDYYPKHVWDHLLHLYEYSSQVFENYCPRLVKGVFEMIADEDSAASVSKAVAEVSKKLGYEISVKGVPLRADLLCVAPASTQQDGAPPTQLRIS